MSSDQFSRAYLPRLLILLAGTVFLFASFSFFSPPAVLILILLAAFALAFYFSPFVGLMSLILIRPSLDIFTDYTVLEIGDFSLNLSSLLAVLSIAFGIYVAVKNFQWIKNLPLRKVIIIFLAICAISILFSGSPRISLAETARLASIFSLYALGYCLVRSKKGLNIFMLVLLFSLAVPAFLAVKQYLGGTGMTIVTEEIYNRIYGTFAHPNLFAYYLVFILALLIFTVIQKSAATKANPAYAVIFIFLAGLLILTYTRGAWLAFLATIFIVGILRFRKFLVLAAIISAVVYLAAEPVRLRLNNLVTSDPSSSVQWRLDLWQDISGYIGEAPLLGHGAGTAQELILDKRGPQFGSSDPHNDYFKLLLENGLVGLFAYLGVVTALLFRLIKNYLAAGDPYLKNLFLIIMSFGAALTVMSSVDNVLRNTALMWSLWALVGAIFAVNQNKKMAKT